MPNTKSAKKELRKSLKRTQYNKRIKNSLKSIIKKTQKAIAVKDEKAKELMPQALKAIDKAAQKGIIKNNTRDRKKSRLHKLFNQTFKA